MSTLLLEKEDEHTPYNYVTPSKVETDKDEEFKYPESEFPNKNFHSSDLDPSNLSLQLQDSLDSNQKMTQ